ncbi:hypothetical protein JR728_004536 [Vibrio vulnificus]|nr:hypothetical protein [Vibrio vulnificus]
MKTIPLSAFIASLLLSTATFAEKVTYEDAVASSAAFYETNNAVNSPPSDRGLGPEEQQSQVSDGASWIEHWSGKTTGSVSVPQSAKEVFIKYISKSGQEEYVVVPTNAGRVPFTAYSISDSGESSSGHNNWSCSESASGVYSNFTVTGDKKGRLGRCYAVVFITGIMYR